MDIQVSNRVLNDGELDIIIDEVKKFKSPVVGDKVAWKKFDTTYVATLRGEIIGMCGVEKVKEWLMLHPFVVLEKYHRQGVGSQMIKGLIDDHPSNNIFIGSQNPAVARIALRSGFKEVSRVYVLPIRVQVYLLKFAMKSFNVSFISEIVRKRSIPRGHFRCFVKQVTS